MHRVHGPGPSRTAGSEAWPGSCGPAADRAIWGKKACCFRDRSPGRGELRRGGSLRRWPGAMKKKLDTRFPAPRIKKIMQTDEDIGKIALAVPVLVSKALELFLQDLCDRTYDITIQKGVRTVSSSHLKQCIRSHNVYDFLSEVVGKVPDIGISDANAADKICGRRKAAEDGSEESSKRTRNGVESHTSNGRGSGRGRGRGRRGGRGVGREVFMTHKKMENQPSKPVGLKVEIANEVTDATEATPVSSSRTVRNFDLNLDPEDEDNEVKVPQDQLSVSATSSAAATPGPSVPQLNGGAQLKDFMGWGLPDMDKIDMDPVQFALSSNPRLEDEDYDNEE